MVLHPLHVTVSVSVIDDLSKAFVRVCNIMSFIDDYTHSNTLIHTPTHTYVNAHYSDTLKPW